MELLGFVPLLSLETTMVGVLAFFIFVVPFLFQRFSEASKTGAARNPRPPPEAGFAWPIIGHLHLLKGCRLTHLIFSGLADVYGPAFIFRLGKYPAIVVSDRELVKELYTTKDSVALNRPKSILGEHLAYDNAMFGLSEYGPYWREMRKLVSLELLSPRRLQLLCHIRASETEISIKELYEFWNEERKASPSFSGFVLAEMNNWFQNLTLNVILRAVVGKRYFGSINGGEEKEARRCREILREHFRLLGMFLVSDLIPWLRWLDLGGYERKMKAMSKEMDQIAEEWLKEHQERRKYFADKSISDHHHQDFMDVMISIMEGADHETADGGYDGDTIIKATCIV